MTLSLIDCIQQRYTTKSFDSSKKISQDDIEKVKKILQLYPSSTNAQPSYFIIASTDAAKERIAKSTDTDFPFNSPSIRNASHVIILCTKTDMDDAHLEKVLAKEESDGRFPTPENKTGMDTGRKTFVNLHKNTFNDLPHWLEKQTYIALGFLLSGLSVLGIDSTTMEGFSAPILDAEFDLPQKGYKSSLIVPIGYHDPQTDYNATLPKSRLSQADIIQEI